MDPWGALGCGVGPLRIGHVCLVHSIVAQLDWDLGSSGTLGSFHVKPHAQRAVVYWVFWTGKPLLHTSVAESWVPMIMSPVYFIIDNQC